MNTIDINDLWHKYCELSGLPEEKMHRVQRIETKRAYYGAIGQLLVVLVEMADNTDEDESTEILDNLTEQVRDFWETEVANKNPN